MPLVICYCICGHYRFVLKTGVRFRADFKHGDIDPDSYRGKEVHGGLIINLCRSLSASSLPAVNASQAGAFYFCNKIIQSQSLLLCPMCLCGNFFKRNGTVLYNKLYCDLCASVVKKKINFVLLIAIICFKYEPPRPTYSRFY